ncbi:hypothetical protein [Alcanivorax hongdengensis]|nr:hypothetical protein [Alcanivorax hongdengensis]
MEFYKEGQFSYTKCGSYRTRELTPGLFISERAWGAFEKPIKLYAPWCFINFAKTEREARAHCRKHANSRRQLDAKQILTELGIPTS